MREREGRGEIVSVMERVGVFYRGSRVVDGGMIPEVFCFLFGISQIIFLFGSRDMGRELCRVCGCVSILFCHVRPAKERLLLFSLANSACFGSENYGN